MARQLVQLLTAAIVVVTAFLTSQPGRRLIDPVSPNENVLDQLTVTRLAHWSDAATIESPPTSMVQLQIENAPRARPCSGFFIAAHLVLTSRHCVMTQTEAASTALDLGTKTIREFELLMSQADLDFSLLWSNTDASPTSLTLETPTAAIRTRLIDRLPLIEQVNPWAATELRDALQ